MLAIECATPMPPLMLAASLYSSCGKLAVEITALGDDRATVTSPERPEAGSFAFLVRNGIKVPSQVAWVCGDRLGLSFEEPINEAWRDSAFRAKR